MESIWQKSVQMPSFPKLQGDVKTDVLVIGGGITGILTAYLLKQSGVDCVLVEKGKISQGTTGSTTAKITWQHGLIYHQILKSSGAESAREYLAANQLAFSRYAQLCSKIDCDYEIKDNYVYSVSDRKKLEDEMLALETIGCTAEWKEHLVLPFPTVGAVKIANQAQFHPLKLKSSIAEGLSIYEHTFVQEMRENGSRFDENGRVLDNPANGEQVNAMHSPLQNRQGRIHFKERIDKHGQMCYNNTSVRPDRKARRLLRGSLCFIKKGGLYDAL